LAIPTENKYDNLLGIILCGGKSIRMGSDKGLLLKEGKPWSVRVAEKFIALNIPFVVSVNDAQALAYQNHFTVDNLVIDMVEIPGPLRGILSVNKSYHKKDLLVLACDMIEMQIITIQKLLDNYLQFPDFDFYAYHNGKFWEPFCGIYTSKALANLKNENTEDFSMQHILNSGNTQKIEMVDKSSFANTNSL
jgi:molybdopterin-guanine dinucleotide biosynthesis protein A